MGFLGVKIFSRLVWGHLSFAKVHWMEHVPALEKKLYEISRLRVWAFVKDTVDTVKVCQSGTRFCVAYN